MQIEAIKLLFSTPLHIGRGNESDMSKSELIYHSDALKSAIFSVGIQQYPEWEKEPVSFFNEFQISSCFPFAKNENFFPKPMLKREFVFTKTDKHLIPKKSKKIEFFSLPLFKKLIEGNDITIDEACITADGRFVCNSSDTFTKTNEKGLITEISFFKSEVQQRVAVPLEWENEKESKPYYTDRIYFEKDCGLFFLAKFNNDLIRQKVLNTIKLLGESGIGSDRSVGNGLFDFNVELHLEKIDLPDIESNKFLNLGLFLPTENEFAQIDFYNSNWNLIKRGGYLGGTYIDELRSLRKKSVFMFTESSVLSSEKKPKGKFIDLKPEWNSDNMHSIWRDGQALLINVM
jgi:CRISPR type III-A-associated RAMP protein Csm4